MVNFRYKKNEYVRVSKRNVPNTGKVGQVISIVPGLIYKYHVHGLGTYQYDDLERLTDEEVMLYKLSN